MNYYYLIAGLPDLSLDVDSPKIDVEEVVDTIRRNLDPPDEAIFQYLLYPHDNRNFLNLLFHKHHNLPKSPLLIPAALAESTLQDYHYQQNALPTYLSEFVRLYEDQFSSLSPRILEENLWNLFYEEVVQQDPFIADYFRFDRQLKEMTAAYNAANYRFLTTPASSEGREIAAIASGKTVPAAWLREYPYLENLGEVIATHRPDQIVKFLDRIRWDYLEEVSSFFNRKQVSTYTLKLLIVVRWQQLEPKLGTARLEELLATIQKPINTPKPSIT